MNWKGVGAPAAAARGVSVFSLMAVSWHGTRGCATGNPAAMGRRAPVAFGGLAWYHPPTMARMIPKDFPPENTSSAEWRLFEALRDGLDRDYLVLHSFPWLDDSRRCPQEGECDFLILHPENGMLAVEAKSGGICYEGPTTRAWRRLDTGEEIKDPFRQAAKTVHGLNDFLCRRLPEWDRIAPPFGHAVAFPEADHVPGNLPPHASPDILILRPDLDRLQARVERILHRWRPPSGCLLPDAVERAASALLPRFEITSSVGARLDAQSAVLFRLTQEQIRLLEWTRLVKRAIVRGVAGSGKTILAMEKATLLAEAGRRVLLLCFNIPLADRLRAQLEERGVAGAGAGPGAGAAAATPGRVDVFCFHDLAEHAVKATGGAYEVPLEDRQKFYDETAIELFYDAVGKWDRRYDAILVDEAQDFAGLWWPPLEALLADRDEGVFYLFTDPGQNIFRRDGRLPFAGPVFTLDVNCRNTARIAALVHRLAPGAAVAGAVAEVGQPRAAAAVGPAVAGAAPAGCEPVVTPVASEDEEREAVRQALHSLVHEQGVRPERIVILGRHRFQNSAFAAQPRLGSFQVIDNLEPGAPHHIRYATIHRFKGLEADCVLVTGVGLDPTDPRAPDALDDAERALLYVAASRARLLLQIFPLLSPARAAPREARSASGASPEASL